MIIFSKKDTIKIKEVLKDYLLISILLFFCSFFIGVIFSSFSPVLAEESLKELRNFFSFFSSFGPLKMGIFIFLNNAVKISLFIFLGIIFAIPTIFFLILNGWVLGFVVATSMEFLSIKEVFFALFYHGVFELSALFIGSSLGIWIGVSTYKEIGTYKKEKILSSISSLNIKNTIKTSMKVFFFFAVPLLFIAAIIETFLMFS